MTDTNTQGDTDDPYALGRFVQAQETSYEQALAEITNGLKRSHWMRYVFPQFEGLGISETSRRHSIKSVAEAEAYPKHPVLGSRLLECVEVLLANEGASAHDIFPSVHPGRRFQLPLEPHSAQVNVRLVRPQAWSGQREFPWRKPWSRRCPRVAVQ